MPSSRWVFHNDQWVNLHHFLFQWARTEGEQDPNDSRPRVSIPEQAAASVLNSQEQEDWQAALNHYRERHVADNLVHSERLVAIKAALGDVACRSLNWHSTPPGLEPEHWEILRKAMPVYRSHWWPEHSQKNEAWIDSILLPLRSLEVELTRRIGEAYGGTWPESLVRVDVTTFASWHGAYTTIRPNRITVTSTHRLHKGWTAIEVLLHEASHASFLARPLFVALDAAFEEQGANAPFGLSHVIQFVTAAEILRRTLDEPDAETFEPYADRLGLYDQIPHWAEFKKAVDEHWLPFVDRKLDRQEALEQIARTMSKTVE